MYVSIILCKLVNMFVVIDHPLFDHPLTGHWVHPTPNLQPPQGFRSHSGAGGRLPAIRIGIFRGFVKRRYNQPTI